MLQMHADTTNISALLLPGIKVKGSSVSYRCKSQSSVLSSMFFVSVSFSIKNKYIYLIMGSPLIKKQSSVILLEVPECWMVRNSRLSTFFYHCSFLYANHPARPSIYCCRYSDRASNGASLRPQPAILRQHGT